ncbi:MAG: tagaturonate epimerase family protein [Treponema sp.]|nr:tagaturonate epimerase family protein [Treponema sp.]
MDYSGFDVYENSIHKVQVDGCEIEIFMAKGNSADGGDFLVVGKKIPGFSGEELSCGRYKAPLSHDNADMLRKLFPFAAPSPVLRKDRSFGLGDRLGVATPGHIGLFRHYDAYPVFAQQSIRELNLTNRSYGDVLDAATFAVFREDFRKEWGADGDHLKTPEDVEYALGLGFTMITLDCSEHIKGDVTEANAPPLPEKYRAKYLGKQFDIGEGVILGFSEPELKAIAAIYGDAIGFAAGMYDRFLKDGKYNADFEISIDETATPTTPLQHYFVASELIDAGVSFATIAPRFCGEFQKGIDYSGDLAQFESEIKVHAVIARHFKYKLSIHSGSDKFSVFPSIGRECGGIFHVKTAGTNWLEAMCVIAQTDPALYREVHKYALEAFGEASKYYHVTTDLSKIPCVDSVSDTDLPKLFENNDARQLIHITYGLILGKKSRPGADGSGESFAFKDRLYQNWRKNEDAYALALKRHIGKHLDLLGVAKTC